MAKLIDLIVSGKSSFANDISAKNIYADNFIRNGSSNNYVLLGGGGHKALSDFSMSHSHPYLSYSSVYPTNTINLNDYFSTSTMYRVYYDYSGSSKIQNGPYESDAGAVINFPTYSGTQVYFNYYNNDVKVRTHYNGHITSWATFITSENIGSQSVNYSASAGNADTLDSFHSNRFTFVYNSANYNDKSSLTVNQMAADGNSNSHVGMIYAGTDNPVSSSGNWVHVWSQTWARGTISSWCSQIALGVQQGTGMWYRTTSGALAGRAWNRVLDSANYTSYVNNYYWANVKISTSSNSGTYPTFANMKSTGRVYLDEWIQFSGSTGLYWPNANGAHLYANTTTSYAGLITQGSRGGYCGLQCGPGTTYMTVMSTDTHHGLYCENTGTWEFYYNRGNGGVGIRTSSITKNFNVSGQSYLSSNVWIGTTSGGEMLNVGGGIKTENYITFGTYGARFDSDIRNSWRTNIYGNTTNESRIKTVRTDANINNFSEIYGSGLTWATGDTQGYLGVSYFSGNAWIGGGNSNALNWSTYLVTGNNIGSQSVKYATSAGSANSADILNIKSINSETDIVQSGIRGYSGSGSSWTGSISSMKYAAIFSFGTPSRGWQLWAGRTGEVGNGLCWRRGIQAATSWDSERLILDSNNYTDYTVKKDGTGASGTWGISITGNADTVDGLHIHGGRNNEANKIVRTDGNGYIQAGWINTTSGDMGTTAATRVYCSDDGYIRYKSLANFSSDVAGKLYWANVNVSTSSNSGTSPTFSTCYTSNWFRSTGSTGWYNETYGGGWYMADGSWIRSYGGHGVVAGGFYHSSYGSSAYALTSDGGATHIGSMSVNYANSAGNADTVDYMHASNFSYNVSSDNYDCNNLPYGTHSATYRFSGSPSNAFPNSSWSNMFVIGAGSDTMTQIGAPYDVDELYFRRGTWYSDGGSIRTNTWKAVLHSGNYTSYVNNYYWANVKISTSSNSGTYPTFANMRSTSRVYLDEWLQFNGSSGLYWPNAYSAHFYPNDTSSYGQFRLAGSKNGYSGIHFGSGTGYLTLMDNGSDKGAYQENWGWLWYYNARNGKLSLRTSSDLGADINLSGSVRTNSTYYGYGLYHLSYGSSAYALTSDGGATHIGSMSVYSAGVLRNEASIGAGDTHAQALQTYFNNNYSSIKRNTLNTYYSSAYSNGSFYMGYFLSGYDSNPYGGFFVAHYDTPYYVGISNGSFNQQQIITSSTIGSQSVNYANSAGSSSYATTVGINYNNDSNSTYQMLWGSGNYVYGTGGIYCNPSTDTLYASAFYESSDIRLKQNIKQVLTSNDIPQIKEFDWKNTGKHSYGLIAQELEYMGYFELVDTKDDGYKSVNYTAAHSLIIGKLQLKIKELEDRIKYLESK